MAALHVVGAGMAGLAAAVELAASEGGPRQITVHEAAGHGGGRCRSFLDSRLGCVIDNGNHLILGANPQIFSYLERIAAADRLVPLQNAVFPFIDVKTGERWSIRPNGGPFPWWIFDPGRRAPGTRSTDYLAAWRFLLAGKGTTVAECISRRPVAMERFWRPLTQAVMNCEPPHAAARPLSRVLFATFLKGARFATPYLTRQGLSHALVDPALDYLRARGVSLCFNERVRAIARDGKRAAALITSRGSIPLKPGDKVILAVPPQMAAALLETAALSTTFPQESAAIVNAHFRLTAEGNGAGENDPLPSRDPAPPMGLTGGTGHWIFRRGGIVSMTVSAADALAGEEAKTIAQILWPELCLALSLGRDRPLPPFRIVKEQRATFAQTPEAEARRPPAETGLANLFLAGDWTRTGLPATIEGAVLSGRRAAELVKKGTSVDKENPLN